MTAKVRRRHLALTLKQDLFTDANLSASRSKTLSEALTEFGRALGLLATVHTPPETVPVTSHKRPSTPPTVLAYEDDIIDAEAALRQRSMDERAVKRQRQKEQSQADQMALMREKAQRAAPKERKTVCKYYMDGMCSKGDECTFSHAVKPRKTSIQEVCKFFRSGKCLRGPSCPYSHDLKRVPCKFHHLWGGCAAGAGCKYSHAEFSREELDKWFADIDR